MLETITNSLAFGLIAMVIVGGSWSLVGLVMGDAPKKGIDSSLVQFWGGSVPVIVGLIIIGFQGGLNFACYHVDDLVVGGFLFGINGNKPGVCVLGKVAMHRHRADDCVHRHIQR